MSFPSDCTGRPGRFEPIEAQCRVAHAKTIFFSTSPKPKTKSQSHAPETWNKVWGNACKSKVTGHLHIAKHYADCSFPYLNI